MTLSPEELKLVVRIYLFVGLTLGAIIYLWARGRLTAELIKISYGSFLMAAIGWEVWFTYGLVGGDSVSERRSDALNAAIPQNINWIVNSIADVGMCLIGLYLVRRILGPQSKALSQWRWSGFPYSSAGSCCKIFMSSW